MIGAMKPSTAGRPADSEPARTDASEVGGGKRYGNRHFRPVVTPGVFKGPILPESVSEFFRKLFRRQDTHR
jgi:hypothetical protein